MQELVNRFAARETSQLWKETGQLEKELDICCWGGQKLCVVNWLKPRNVSETVLGSIGIPLVMTFVI